MQPEIFISYSWGNNAEVGESREKIVDEICDALQQTGLLITRDKKDVHYKSDIKSFEDRLGKGNYIILIISDSFLKSKHCMYEVLKIIEHEDVYNRIFPIVLEDAKIYNPFERLYYINYWSSITEKLDKEIKEKVPLVVSPNIISELQIFSKISSIFDPFVALLNRMCTLSSKIHRENSFAKLKEAIKKQIEQNQRNSESQGGNEQHDVSQSNSNIGTIVTGDLKMTGKYVSGRDITINK